MSWIKSKDEIERLERAFAKRIAAWPRALAAASLGLLARVEVRRDSPRRWVDSFTPLTLLYPMFQAEAFRDPSRRVARRATLAHLFSLIHVFVEDRRLDRQLQLEPAEILFSRQALAEALAALETMDGSDRSAAGAFGHLLAESAEAEITPYVVSRKRKPKEAAELERAESLVASRAAPGAAATLALAAACHARRPTVIKMRRAYDRLVVGLQWGDDLEDWTEDLGAGRPNLLLHLLAVRGFTPRPERPICERISETGAALIAKGVIPSALARGRAVMAEAADLQLRLGAIALSKQIEQKARLFVRTQSALTESFAHALLARHGS